MSTTPLAGLRVLDLTRLLPGGLCTLVLADLGADVIKIEQPGTGDYARAREPFVDEGADATTASASFRGLNRNKRSVVLDLKRPEAIEALLLLARDADVLVESFRPGVLERLGLGPGPLAEANPRLIVCRISGWGPEGDHALRAGHDLTYLAETGLLSFTGAPDDPPAVPPVQTADAASGLFAAIGVLTALHERARSGTGQVLQVPIAHAALPLAAMTVAAVLAAGAARPTGDGVWSGGAICYRTYRCADGWVALAALEEKFWRTWCEGVGRPDLIAHRYDPPGSPAHAQVEAVLAARTRDEWDRFARAHDCCLSVVRGLDEALASPLIVEGGMTPPVRTPEGAPGTGLGLPLGLSRTPPEYDRLPPPALGADTEEVLRAAGLSGERLDALLSSVPGSS